MAQRTEQGLTNVVYVAWIELRKQNWGWWRKWWKARVTGELAALQWASFASIFLFPSDELNVLSTISESLKLNCKKRKNADESCHGNLSSPLLPPLDTADTQDTLWSCIFYSEQEADTIRWAEDKAITSIQFKNKIHYPNTCSSISTTKETWHQFLSHNSNWAYQNFFMNMINIVASPSIIKIRNELSL